MEKQLNQEIAVNKSKAAVASFYLGLVSIFIGGIIGVIPIIAIITGIVGISDTKEPNTGRWKAVVGLLLGGTYLLVNANMYGHL